MINEMNDVEREKLAVLITEKAISKYGKHSADQLRDLLEFCLPFIARDTTSKLISKYCK